MNELSLYFKRSGEPLGANPVVVRFKQNWTSNSIEEKTDQDGKVLINCPVNEIESLEVAGIIVKQNWYVEGGREEYFDVPDPVKDINIDVIPAEGWHLLKLKFNYEDGEPVGNAPVIFIIKTGGMFSSDHKIETETNQDGWARIHLKEDTIEEISIAGVSVLKNFYINGKEVEEYVKIPEAGEGYDQEDNEMIYKIKGQLYYFDGTQPYQDIKIELESDQFDRERIEKYSESDGSFFIDLPNPLPNRFLYQFRWYVAGEKIDPRRIHFHNNFVTIILPEINFIGKNGLDGGVVTGRVVDKNGEGIHNMNVSAQVRSGSFISSAFSTNWVDVKSNKKGYFALGFSGGIEIENILVEGKEPSRIYKKKINKDTGEKIEVDLTSPILRAGSFNIQLETGWKLFGSF